MTDSERKGNRWVGNLVKAGGLALFLIIGIVAISQDDQTIEPANGSSTQERSTAWMICKDSVKDRLNNPATADFSLLSTSIEGDDASGYDISGSLTAANDFGVEEEIAFSCQVRDGSVTASVASSN